MARRKNASFTGSVRSPSDTTRGDPLATFYRLIDIRIPGRTPVPIPPNYDVHPRHDAETQAFIFADYAVRKFAPIFLDARGGEDDSTSAAKLRKLPKIVNRDTAKAAASSDVARRILGAGGVADEGDAFAAARAATYDFNMAASFAAATACHAAELNPDATWEAVNEMIVEL
jgi:hypothetical protein